MTAIRGPIVAPSGQRVRPVDRGGLVQAVADWEKEVIDLQQRLDRAQNALYQCHADLIDHDDAVAASVCPTCMGDGVVEVGVGPAAHDVPCPGCPGTGELDRERVEMASEHAADGWGRE